MRKAWLASGALLLAVSARAAPEPPLGPVAGGRSPQTFSVRADRSLSRRLNPVLQRLGKPIRAKLPPNRTPEAYLRDICGYAKPTWSYASDDATNRTIFYGPCLLADRNVEMHVRRGDSIPAFSVRMGLLLTSQGGLKVHRAPASPTADRKILYPGDTVVAPELPSWTEVVMASRLAGGRTAFEDALAAALSCESEAPATCLKRFSVSVLDDTPRSVLPKAMPRPPKKPEASTGPGLETPSAPLSSPGRGPNDTASSAAAAPSVSSFAEDAAVAEPDLAAGPAPAGTTQTPASRVARGQWPYDSGLVSRILKDAAANPALSRAPVGVIDVGLLDDDGGPLPRDSYAAADPTTEDPLRLVGDGAPFRRDMPSSVAICAGGFTNAATLMADPKAHAAFSHGAVTASIASGLALRHDAVPASILPQLVFFRLYSTPCPPAGDATVQPSDVIHGLESMYDRLDIVNLSYQDDGGDSAGFPEALITVLRASERLLVVPAGNDGAENLDKSIGEYCPACLANPDYTKAGGVISRRVLAVGAANAQLEAETYTGTGLRTVKLYAPGRPSGAVDLENEDASSFTPSTSYAAPQVALAAALARTLAPNVNMARIVKRMLISTWPLYDRGRVVPDVGVIDLTKIVAINAYAVEVRDTEEGRNVLRTYVGQLTTPLSSLNICPGPGLKASVILGLVFGEADPDTGYRDVSVYPQRFRNDEYVVDAKKHCLPSGVLEINAVRDGQKTIPLSVVTKILTPLLP